jgi:hypothetical protein
VVEEQRPPGLEVLVEALERLEILRAVAAEREAAADHDRPVGARWIELVHRLDEECRRQPLALSTLAAEGDHVLRDVAAVHVQPGAQVRKQQPARPAGDVEGGLAVTLDEAPEVVDLSPALVELGPPFGNEAVVPGLRRHGTILSPFDPNQGWAAPAPAPMGILRREPMERIELLRELVEREPLVRWTAVATAGLAWLSVAWFSPLPLLAAVLLVGSVFAFRRRRGDHLSAAPDDELDLF